MAAGRGRARGGSGAAQGGRGGGKGDGGGGGCPGARPGRPPRRPCPLALRGARVSPRSAPRPARSRALSPPERGPSVVCACRASRASRRRRRSGCRPRGGRAARSRRPLPRRPPTRSPPSPAPARAAPRRSCAPRGAPARSPESAPAGPRWPHRREVASNCSRGGGSACIASRSLLPARSSPRGRLSPCRLLPPRASARRPSRRAPPAMGSSNGAVEDTSKGAFRARRSLWSGAPLLALGRRRPRGEGRGERGGRGGGAAHARAHPRQLGRCRDGGSPSRRLPATRLRSSPLPRADDKERGGRGEREGRGWGEWGRGWGEWGRGEGSRGKGVGERERRAGKWCGDTSFHAPPSPCDPRAPAPPPPLPLRPSRACSSSSPPPPRDPRAPVPPSHAPVSPAPPSLPFLFRTVQM